MKKSLKTTGQARDVLMKQNISSILMSLGSLIYYSCRISGYAVTPLKDKRSDKERLTRRLGKTRNLCIRRALRNVGILGAIRLTYLLNWIETALTPLFYYRLTFSLLFLDFSIGDSLQGLSQSQEPSYNKWKLDNLQTLTSWHSIGRFAHLVIRES